MSEADDAAVGASTADVEFLRIDNLLEPGMGVGGRVCAFTTTGRVGALVAAEVVIGLAIRSEAPGRVMRSCTGWTVEMEESSDEGGCLECESCENAFRVA